MAFHRTRNVDQPTESAIQTWARQWRGNQTGEISISSVLGRLQDQGPAAGETGKRGQRWAEVYTGDAIVVHRIMHGMSELPRQAVQTYYVMGLIKRETRPSIAEQAAALGVTKTRFWAELDKGEEVIRSGLELLEDRPGDPKPMFTLRRT